MSETFAKMTGLAKESATWAGHGLLKRAYELRSPSRLYATLAWESAFGSLAQAKVDGAAWTFKRVGFFHPHVTVRAPGSETDLAVYRHEWTGNGRVELPNGHTWKWRCLSFWRSRYGFVDDGDEPMVAFKANTFKTPPTAELALTDRALALEELPLLVVLGWYVTILAFDDAAGAGAAAAAGA